MGYSEPDADENSNVTLGELGRRLAELQTERTRRLAVATSFASALALMVSLFALVVAL
jgi:hypothetical protein